MDLFFLLNSLYMFWAHGREHLSVGLEYRGAKTRLYYSVAAWLKNYQASFVTP